MVTIWHNTRCSKSREALKALEEKGVQYTVFEYLKNPFTKDELKQVIKKLNITDIRDMLRHKETIYKELDIDDEQKTQDEIIDLVVKNPKLIERPIIIKDDKAVIARPLEKLYEVI